MKRILCLLAVGVPILGFSQGYQLNLQNIRNTGMGGVGVAHPWDATSQFYNPGSAAFLKENSVSAGVTGAISKGTFTDRASGKVNNSDNPLVTPLYANALFGNPEGRIRYGISIYTPYGSTMKWEPGFTGQFENTKISLLSVGFQPTVSFKVTDRLGIGAGFVYGYGHLTLNRNLPLTKADGQYGSAEISSGAHSYGYNIGLYYKLSDQWSLGADYRSGLRMKSNKNGKATFDVPTALSSQFPNQNITAELPLPSNWSFGVAFKPNDRLTVEADFLLADWKSYDTINVIYTHKTDYLSETKLVRKYGFGYSYRLGANYVFNNQWDGRVGISYNRSPIPNDLVNPDVPDANRLNPSIGIGYSPNSKWRIDASFLYEHISRSGKNRLSELDGSYKFNLYLPGVGVTYKF